MIEITVKTTLVFALAITVNRILRRGSAAQRHAVWMLAFAAVPVVCLFSRIPSSYVPVVPLIVVEAIPISQPAESTGSFIPVWMTGTALLLLRLAFSFAWLWRNRETVSSPLTFGLIRPQILLPKSAIHWSPALRTSVLLHEQAHISRGDTIAQLFAQVVCAFIWFQPLAWYASRRAADERERACDNLVILKSGVLPIEYANHLVEIARQPDSPPCAGIAMARQSSLEERLQAIVSDSVSRGGVTFRFRLSLLIAAAVLVSGISVLSAQGEKVYKIGEAGVIAPRLTRKIEPQYTAEAQNTRVTGEVVVSTEITKEGTTRNVKVVTGLNEDLDKSAVAAVSEWRFEPATKDGKPVACTAIIKISFRLQ